MTPINHLNMLSPPGRPSPPQRMNHKIQVSPSTSCSTTANLVVICLTCSHLMNSPTHSPAYMPLPFCLPWSNFYYWSPQMKEGGMPMCSMFYFLRCCNTTNGCLYRIDIVANVLPLLFIIGHT